MSAGLADALGGLSSADKSRVYQDNARRAYALDARATV
jgi:hypothetical protein